MALLVALSDAIELDAAQDAVNEVMSVATPVGLLAHLHTWHVPCKRQS